MKKLIVLGSLFISSICFARPMGYYDKQLELNPGLGTLESIQLSKNEYSRITVHVKGDPKEVLICQLLDLDMNLIDENKIPTDFCVLGATPGYDKYYYVKVINTSKDNKVTIDFKVTS